MGKYGPQKNPLSGIFYWVICEKVAPTHHLRIRLWEQLLVISPETIQRCFEISYFTNLEKKFLKTNFVLWIFYRNLCWGQEVAYIRYFCLLAPHMFWIASNSKACQYFLENEKFVSIASHHYVLGTIRE